MRIILICILIFPITIMRAQQPYADCDKAIDLAEGTSKYVLLSGYGKKEISSGTGDERWFDNEHNVCWLKLAVKSTGTMTIEIEPGEPANIDFMLFRYNGENFCNDVSEKKVQPVRSNLSPGKGKTGLSTGAKEDFEGKNSLSQYSRSIAVQQGEVYYLVVDHNSEKGGGAMIGYSVKDESSERAPVQVDKNALVPSVPLNVHIVDDATGEPVTASISIEGLVPSEAVKETASSYTASLSSSQSVRIDCNAPGYMFAASSAIAPALDPNDPSTFQPVNIEVRLKKIQKGEKVTLRNIKFLPDKAEFVPGSYPALQALAAFMQGNPGVKIEIGGHINGPDGSSAAGKAMSKKRAKAVYDYLVKSGIDKGRLKYKGYGNTQMIYPAPLNERQADENRRVEIKIISN